MDKTKNWPKSCSLMGCSSPDMRPHHHHIVGGYLLGQTCQCEKIDQPGTRAVDV